jgi:hypothetical protein
MPTPNRPVDPEPEKPTAFIGSSLEGLRVAEQLQKGLQKTVKCTVWTQGVFGLGQGTLEALVEATKKNEFAVLVLTPDDLADKRGERTSIPRDNVIFELGLFMGAIGKERTFIVHPREVEVPSDLKGITTAPFGANTEDLSVALEEVCKQLNQAMMRTSESISGFAGHWFSSYQRHDYPRVGDWVDDETYVQSKPPGKLIFRNFQDPVGSAYEAVGEFRSEKEIVGVWRETLPGAHASGAFQLYVDPFGHKLYGLCTGPTSRGENIYSGWVLVRDNRANLEDGKRELVNAMFVGRLPQVVRTSQTGMS